jgi:hypothetical protein
MPSIDLAFSRHLVGRSNGRANAQASGLVNLEMSKRIKRATTTGQATAKVLRASQT